MGRVSEPPQNQGFQQAILEGVFGQGRSENQLSLKKSLIKSVIERRLTEAIADANTLAGSCAIHLILTVRELSQENDPLPSHWPSAA